MRLNLDRIFRRANDPDPAGKAHREDQEGHVHEYETERREVVRENLTDRMSGEGPCWEGYEQYGMKDKGGKKVPNCVPKKKSSGQTKPDRSVDLDVLTRIRNQLDLEGKKYVEEARDYQDGFIEPDWRGRGASIDLFRIHNLRDEE